MTLSGPRYIRKHRGRPYCPVVKEKTPMPIEEKPKRKSMKGVARKLGPKSLETFRRYEKEIIAWRKKNYSGESIANELRDKYHVKAPPTSLFVFFKLLAEEGKLKPVKVVGRPSARGPNERTRKILDPHREFILESFAQGKKRIAVLAALRQKGANVSDLTLKRYYLWLKPKKK